MPLEPVIILLSLAGGIGGGITLGHVLSVGRWRWQRNPFPRACADDHYWHVKGPDGRSLAMTVEAVAEARQRAARLNWR
jgi:hypothetical protein